MKKIVMVLAVFSSAVWLSSSLFLACLKTTTSVAEAPTSIIAMEVDGKPKFRPAEFSAEIRLDETDRQVDKVDSNVTKKMDQAKRDMMQISASRPSAAVR
ncbi:MAG: hypothetical protein SGJ27_14895 [Candidatus Melainabacteria bacterium]|nr:hypothetical protein [Candidatus Melainabacteria bacterium]